MEKKHVSDYNYIFVHLSQASIEQINACSVMSCQQWLHQQKDRYIIGSSLSATAKYH